MNIQNLFEAISIIRNRKIYSIIIFFIIICSSLSFSAAYALLVGLDNPFQKMNNNLKGSHLTIVVDPKSYNVNTIENWWASKIEVESRTALLPFIRLNSPIINKNKMIKEICLTELLNGVKDQDKLLIVQGENKKNPQGNEVWIPHSWANENKIKIGDNIQFDLPQKSLNLKVGATIVDPVFSVPNLNSVRIWCEKDFLKNNFNNHNEINYFLGVRFFDKKDVANLWSKFEVENGEAYGGEIFKYSDLEIRTNFDFKIIGLIMFIGFIVWFITTSYLIYILMNDLMIKEYRIIGVLKAGGREYKDIMKMYIYQVMIIAIFSVLLGTFLCNWMINFILSKYLENLGIDKLSVEIGQTFVVTFIVLMCFLFAVSYLCSLKTAKMEAAKAIKFGDYRDNYSKINIDLPDKIWQSPIIVLAYYHLLAKKKQLIFPIIIILISTFILGISFHASKSIEEFANNRGYLGYDNSDFTVISKGQSFGVKNTKINSILRNEKRIQNIMQFKQIKNSIINDERTNISYRIIGNCYDGNMNTFGLTNITGQNPQNIGEVSLAQNTSRQLKKNVGDMVKIKFDNNIYNLQVTGIYRVLSDGGQGFRISVKTIKKFNKDYELDIFMVKALKNVELENLESVLNKKVGKLGDVLDSKVLFENKVKVLFVGLKKIISYGPFLLSIGLMIIIMGANYLYYIKNIKIWQILKILGVLDKENKNSLILKNCFLVMIVTFISLILAVFYSANFVGQIFEFMGFQQLPIKLSVLGSIYLIFLVIIITYFSSYLTLNKLINFRLKD